MKILWLSHLIPYPPKGGVLQRSFHLIREVSRTNTIYLIAFNQRSLLRPGPQLESAVSALTQYCHAIEVVRLPSDRTRLSKHFLAFKSLFTPNSYTVNWNYSPEMNERVLKAINSFHPDLLHYDTLGMAQYLQSQSRIPQVLNHHNIESAMMFRRAKNEVCPAKKLYFLQEAIKIQTYEKRVSTLISCNIAVSEEDASTLQTIVPAAKIAVIPNGVDTSYFSRQTALPHGETLIFAGGLNWYPNSDAMVYFSDKIWPLLKKRRPMIRLVVIGQSPPKKLLNLSRKDPNFVLTGYVDDVRPYFEQATVYVCPIRDGGGTRLKILDALSFGIPIVASSTAVEGIRVTNHKDILIADTPEEFANAVLRLLDNRELRTQIALHGRLLVKQLYDWKIIGEKLRNLYSALVD